MFIEGLTPILKTRVAREQTDLLVFQRDNRHLFPEPIAPKELHADGIFNRLSAADGPHAMEALATGGSKRPQVSAIVQSMPRHLTDVLHD